MPCLVLYLITSCLFHNTMQVTNDVTLNVATKQLYLSVAEDAYNLQDR